MALVIDMAMAVVVVVTLALGMIGLAPKQH